MCRFQSHEIYMLQLTLTKQYGCFKLVHSSKKSGGLLSAGAQIQAFVSHCSANFQPILDCFISNFKLKYEDSENIKADRVNTVVLTYINSNVGRFFWVTQYTYQWRLLK